MVQGFSKFSKQQKREWLQAQYLQPHEAEILQQYDLAQENAQQLHDDFIENSVANYLLPLGIAPNFLIDGKWHTIPLAIEESSVVAALSKAGKFWSERGGFTTEVLGVEKVGQVHFFFKGNPETLTQLFPSVILPRLLADTAPLTANMKRRGGGILGVELRNKTAELPHYYQLHARFQTQDAMGANFINSCLEQFAKTLENIAQEHGFANELQVNMSILSNYVPQCVVRARVSAPIAQMSYNQMPAERFCQKFVDAIAIANADIFRAVTHNKGIMNGIDAVVLATGNDFRAIEAGAHAYAARNGKYQSLSEAHLSGDRFHFSVELPLALGTVGGLTSLHPMARTALKILQNPTAPQLMSLIASVGLAQNFAAVSSLITSGIQKGHMKMHLSNILNQLGATPTEKAQITAQFQHQTVTHAQVAEALERLRKA